MSDSSSSVLAFSIALQHKLHIEISTSPLIEGVWLLQAAPLPFQLVYYALQPYRSRVPMTPGIRSIHIDEDRWITRPELLLNRIAALAGQSRRLYARDTVAARIDKPTALSFQEEHHLQVSLPGKYRFGLFHHGELVAIALFSGGRSMHDRPAGHRSFELLRFCHKQGAHVVGGFSKLLETFQRAFNPGDIMTYADSDWSDGSSYRKVGFIPITGTQPQLFWVDAHTFMRYHEGRLPPTLHEMPAADRLRAGFIPVYNGGSIKLVKTSG
ncbi:hypothetical protein [Parapedobacter lycopersici]|uniref:hypothetical protein n=1 Tax=Parapedobacter lycopersici TaxID=1864939 RepID=UPI00214D4A62|nr:hypothetical protein [Parapedobacter lycopersici]